MSVYEKLMKVQGSLKAPKGQYNSFGKYKYRSCEDILEALKPILSEVGAIITINDNIIREDERTYVQAIASFIDIENGEKISTSAFAREALTKKGMDESQVTGAASSYARKYALNGLFAIDDSKDMDYLNKDDRGSNTSRKRPSKKLSADELYKKAGEIRVQGGKYESLTLLEVEEDSPDTITEWYRISDAGERKQVLKAIIDKRK